MTARGKRVLIRIACQFCCSPTMTLRVLEFYSGIGICFWLLQRRETEQTRGAAFCFEESATRCRCGFCFRLGPDSLQSLSREPGLSSASCELALASSHSDRLNRLLGRYRSHSTHKICRVQRRYVVVVSGLPAIHCTEPGCERSRRSSRQIFPLSRPKRPTPPGSDRFPSVIPSG